MANNYVVFLDKSPVFNVWKKDFFPRSFHYKNEANDLVMEVLSRGGEAHVVPSSQLSDQLIRTIKQIKE